MDQCQAVALNCYICGDNNLDEFGECTDQFPYDCGTYARRFDPSERIYCRTTRNRSANNTYTIMKECISESDHYKSFPKKTYPLDEECDLIDVNGYEVAYCLCRHNDYCNHNAIADQFVAFEELHPELFGEMPLQTSTSSEQVSSTFAPVAFPSDGDLRRQQTNPHQTRNFGGSRVSDIDISAPQIVVHPKDETSRNHQKVLSSSTFAEHEDADHSSALRCLQCGQGNLPDEAADCSQQVVVDCQRQLGDIAGGRAFCFSRQILLGSGQNVVEKMCVSEHTLQQELQIQEVADGCGFSDGNRVRYCVCSDDECNRNSINQKMLMHVITAPASEPIVTSSASPESVPVEKSIKCQACTEGNMANPTDCQRPTEMECKGENPLCLTRQTQLSNGAFSFEKRCISESEYEQNFPDEADKLSVGCSSAFDGYVNYCICNSDLCNKGSLVEQGGLLGSKRTFPSFPTTVRPAVLPTSPRNRPNDNFAHEAPPLTVKHPSNTLSVGSSTAPTLHTKSVKDRQERWKDFGSSASLSTASAVTLPILVLFHQF
ncbi:hypothetical protein L596_003114 [Steinernema carpocapsae]|uniref:UPAR/Ly6 domain-containing protein n=1 Tax=Steinernema carpocapsae TaxID=34508 RepID=A0A4U8URK1_STECR|nr:hypothetical protein L596_003114 [Steinernema carpocapsae]